ncbi:biotin--[acetyl-CoA-carboxylase] ligase [Propionimicrobium sp. PCR01-08-3]|uniref:biotin--[acetyl-CoA-carboxylase] ligase n=1 Tax=Propionimicrobium sp. PCR01-08-3 TaxID=3052086 RepID=UPI00255D00AE|nr:biotin--[acetyl-CoA-carboxylase] ligase [Propionimicrobium sp. PCR01-08-3]WIY83308.1 biotin--[acetyl-CoA-carboxylase] ligase [Propionimicrobium sp. PCR01-08-3]
MPRTPAANAERISDLLGAKSFWRIRTIEVTGSTNEDLADLARQGAGSGEVLIAEHQAAGRGRFERVWQSPPGSSISTSVLLRPRREPFVWGWLSLLIGLAVTDGLRALGGGDRVQLKWPNDALIDGKKVCGILSEVVTTEWGNAAICGWGINVSLDESELPVPQATSLLLAGLPTDKDLVSAAVLGRLGDLFARWDAGEDLSAEYAAGCATVGRSVRVHLDAESPDSPSVTGQAVGIGEHGELLVELGDRVEAFAAGDVVHLR